MSASPDEDTDGAPRPSADEVATARRQRRIGRAFLGTIVGAVVLGLVPPYLVRASNQADVACSNADYDDHPGASAGCGWKAHAWLALPKVLPWSRTEALAADRALDRKEGDRSLRRSSLIAPDAKQRDDAAAAYLAACQASRGTVPGSGGATRPDDPSAYAVAVLVGAGAFSTAARAGDLARSATNLRWALEAALSAGDVGRALELARTEPTSGPTYDFLLRAGALLCLEGDTEGGRPKLEASAADYRTHVGYESNEAAIAITLCGGPRQRSDAPGRTGRDLAALLAGRLDDLTTLPDVDRRPERPPFDVRDLRSPFVAAWLAQGKHDPGVVDVVAPIAPSLRGYLSPWALGAVGVDTPFGRSDPLAIDPDAHEKAARALEALAEEVTAKAPPADARGKTSPVGPASASPTSPALPTLDGYDEPARSAIARARGDVAATYRARADVLWAEAAYVRALVGRSAEARVDVERAARSADTLGLVRLAAISMAVDDDVGAERLLAKASSDQADGTGGGAMADLLLASIAMHQGKAEEAHVAAKRARQRQVPALEGPAAWMLSATSLKLDRAADAPGIPTPTIFERGETTWEKLAKEPDEKRADARMRMQSLDASSPALLVMPAIFYVVGRAADGHDVDAYLDAVFGIHYRLYWSPMALRARAEAARWRGDAEAASRFTTRAAELAKLLDRPDHLVLARFAGLL